MYVKAYQYLCECLKGDLFITLFFHLFCCHYGTGARPREWELVSLLPMIQVFEGFHGLKPFTDCFFLVNPFHLFPHLTICGSESGVNGKCKPLFPHYWSVKHFFMKNVTYVYKDEDFSFEDSYKKRGWWTSLIAWVILEV